MWKFSVFKPFRIVVFVDFSHFDKILNQTNENNIIHTDLIFEEYKKTNIELNYLLCVQHNSDLPMLIAKCPMP